VAEKTDLERAFTTLKSKASAYKTLFDYYDGDQPLVYTASRLREVFQGLDANFSENWCSVVINACLDRINLREMTLANGEKNDVLTALWQRSRLDLESDAVHEAALVTGEAFVIVWPNDETEEPDAFYNDPRHCCVFYDPSNPRRKRFAAKWWLDVDERCRMTLYYPDRIEYYAARKPGWPEKASALVTDEPTVENPYGEVPVFHFTVARRAPRSDLKVVIPLQNGINKLFADMLVAAEYAAFLQRWIISDADLRGKIKNTPGGVWVLPPGSGEGQGVSVGQFASTDLDNFIRPITNLVETVSALTRTPRHMFYGAPAQVSGEALTALEAPLNKKVQDRIDRFRPVWQEVGAFALRIANQQVRPSEIAAAFDRPETVQPRTEAEILQLRTSGGIPLASALRMQGLPEDEIATILREKAVEQAAEAQRTAASGIAGPGRQAAQAQSEAAGLPVTQRLVQKAVEQFAESARAALRGSGA